MLAFAAAAQLQFGPQLSLQSPLQPQPSRRRVAFSALPRVVAFAHAAAQGRQGTYHTGTCGWCSVSSLARAMAAIGLTIRTACIATYGNP